MSQILKFNPRSGHFCYKNDPFWKILANPTHPCAVEARVPGNRVVHIRILEILEISEILAQRWAWEGTPILL